MVVVVIIMSINVAIIFMLRYTVVCVRKKLSTAICPDQDFEDFEKRLFFFSLLVSSCLVFVVLVAGCCGVAYSEIALTFLLTFNY